MLTAEQVRANLSRSGRQFNLRASELTMRTRHGGCKLIRRAYQLFLGVVPDSTP